MTLARRHGSVGAAGFGGLSWMQQSKMVADRLRVFQPILAGVRLSDRLQAWIGSVIGVTVALAVCMALPLPVPDIPLLVAPIGASAVLMFAVPASPMAQPWPVIGGNVISALVGIATFKLVPDPALAAGLAVGFAILVMSLLRCLHPPGGASALTAVIGSDAIHHAGFAFAFLPVGINSVTLVLVGLLFHRMTRHSYPHRPVPVADAGLHLADIDAALEDMHESFDISREDLDALLSRAELHAIRRKAMPAPK